MSRPRIVQSTVLALTALVALAFLAISFISANPSKLDAETMRAEMIFDNIEIIYAESGIEAAKEYCKDDFFVHGNFWFDCFVNDNGRISITAYENKHTAVSAVDGWHMSSRQLSGFPSGY